MRQPFLIGKERLAGSRADPWHWQRVASRVLSGSAPEPLHTQLPFQHKGSVIPSDPLIMTMASRRHLPGASSNKRRPERGQILSYYPKPVPNY